MQIGFSAQNIDELFAEWSQRTEASLQVNSSETILELPPQMGKGWIRQMRLSSE
ncbi:MAG: hypothetical protein CLLPBCKN_001948 [Chroococcidiopsis cubana SAG 39.79]|jgi:hypothetical protein|uniref:AraC family transcription regulator n=1 Tax=Chroococcidiopsis thermalis (strain PCC 7203) TaxID=251229 RepID=K9TYX3_CHRTP|nr:MULTISPECIES: hypothetical protein [Chroococcidiopsis]AFY88042.1 AraC family transcription regulator [Chroococcidiopsis thermalis PCC 7203]MDZ4872560.1 hypothetical protein [Chroococcidiopsis cubana SAG 39.79]URD52968.1 hypothetical protein M5J74_13415 [Chroococcidiopsis sp. CCNUC1]